MGWPFHSSSLVLNGVCNCCPRGVSSNLIDTGRAFLAAVIPFGYWLLLFKLSDPLITLDLVRSSGCLDRSILERLRELERFTPADCVRVSPSPPPVAPRAVVPPLMRGIPTISLILASL